MCLSTNDHKHTMSTDWGLQIILVSRWVHNTQSTKRINRTSSLSSMSVAPWACWDSSRACEIQTIFTILPRCYLPFLCVDICTDGASNGSETGGTLRPSEGVAPNYTSPHGFTTKHSEKEQNKPVSLKNVLEEAVKIIHPILSLPMRTGL